MQEVLNDKYKALRLVNWYKVYLQAVGTNTGNRSKFLEEFKEITGLPFNGQFLGVIYNYLQSSQFSVDKAQDSVNYHTIHKITEFGHVYIDVQNIKLPASWMGAFKSVQWPKFLPAPVSEYSQVEKTQ